MSHARVAGTSRRGLLHTAVYAGFALVLLSLAGGWAFRAIESGSVPMLRTTLRPVRAPEVMPLGYVYRVASRPMVSTSLLRRHTGLEPDFIVQDGCTGPENVPLSETLFYATLETDAVGDLTLSAARRCVESFSITQVGGRLPVWRSTVELPTAGDLQTTGTLRLGPLWIATRPAWPGFLLTTALTTAMLMALRAVTAALWRLARSWRTPPGFCRACRYDLDGLPPGPCPECGRRT